MREKFNTYTLTRPRLRRLIGFVFVVIGFLGLITPLVPGFPLLFVGLEILGIRLLYADKFRSFFARNKKSLPQNNQPENGEVKNLPALEKV